MTSRHLVTGNNERNDHGKPCRYIVIWCIFASAGYGFAYVESRVNKAPMRLKLRQLQLVVIMVLSRRRCSSVGGLGGRSAGGGAASPASTAGGAGLAGAVG